MTVLYFAWIREQVGLSEERVSPPAEVATVAQLIDWLSTRGPGYAAAFADRRRVKAARDQEHVPLDAPLAGAQEVAFFPPVTGG
ncbi:MAG: molybdopterin converting factor subunit 1 [Rhodospirillaceae bacterium]|nr:molybdopterin converting factor subunit 1 [Rhodospirillaceae bacterium]